MEVSGNHGGKNNMNKTKPVIWIRGAGELGSAAAVSLFRAGFRIFLSEINPPLAIRRPVTFSDAVIEGESFVEDVSAKLVDMSSFPLEKSNYIPLLLDKPEQLKELSPDILVDVRMKKRYNSDYRNWAKFVIGLGPGFSAGRNCHAVIETMRGHNLGKVIWKGKALPDTGIPGNVGGETKRRVIKSPGNGILKWNVSFGDIVQEGDEIGSLDDNTAITSPLSGIVRGLINPAVPVTDGLKIGDIDPRGDVDYLSISDKARSIGRAVLEAVLINTQS